MCQPLLLTTLPICKTARISLSYTFIQVKLYHTRGGIIPYHSNIIPYHGMAISCHTIHTIPYHSYHTIANTIPYHIPHCGIAISYHTIHTIPYTIPFILSVTRSLTHFDLWLYSTTTATLQASKFCTVMNMYLMNMNIFFTFLLYSCGS